MPKPQSAMPERSARKRTLSAFVAILLTFGCAGDQGPMGPAGPQGDDGVDGTPAPATTQAVTGAVAMPGGGSNVGLVIQAIVLDLDGGETTTVGAAVTDASGAFTVDIPSGLPLGLQVLLRAIGDGIQLDAFALTATTGIDAASNGVARLVRQIASSRGGASLQSFNAAAIGTITTAAGAALVSGGTDTSDPGAVFDEVRASVGVDVSAASGATVVAEIPTPAVTTDPPGADAPIVSFSYSLVDALSEIWDVEADGSIDDGTNDAYDDFFDLFIDSVAIVPDTTVLRDGRTVVVETTASGLDITRKIHVPEAHAWVRFTEVLTNPSAGDITVDVQVEGNTGSDEGTDLAHATSSGDGTVSPGDEWMTSHWELADPALGFLFPGASNVVKSDDDIDYYWNDVVVPAGGTVTLFHWGFQRSATDVDALSEELSTIGAVPDATYYEGATIADASNGLNGGMLASVSGEAGSAVPGEALTISNTTQAMTVMSFAAFDGSFASALPVATGDQVTITGDLGTDRTVIVP